MLWPLTTLRWTCLQGGGHCITGTGRPRSQLPASHQPDKAAAAGRCAAARQAGHGAGEQLRRGRRPSGRQNTRHGGSARSGGARAKCAAGGPCEPGSSTCHRPHAAASARDAPHAGGGHQPGAPGRAVADASRRLSGPRAVGAADSQPAAALGVGGPRHKQQLPAGAQPARHRQCSTGRQTVQGHLTTAAAASAAAAGACQPCASKAAAGIVTLKVSQQGVCQSAGEPAAHALGTAHC